MIVRHFLQWVRTAAAADRADATSALARAFLYSDLSPDDRIAAEGALVMLLDDDLVDRVGAGAAGIQVAIARRAGLPRVVAAAIAEVAAAEACLTLIENDSAEIAPFSFDRMLVRHGHLAAVREALLAREN